MLGWSVSRCNLVSVLFPPFRRCFLPSFRSNEHMGSSVSSTQLLHWSHSARLSAFVQRPADEPKLAQGLKQGLGGCGLDAVDIVVDNQAREWREGVCAAAVVHSWFIDAAGGREMKDLHLPLRGGTADAPDAIHCEADGYSLIPSSPPLPFWSSGGRYSRRERSYGKKYEKAYGRFLRVYAPDS